MKSYIVISRDAECDLIDIWSYFASKEGIIEADKILSLIEETIKSIQTFPNKGHFPPELERLNESNYREIHCLPYRIIYKINKSEIVIHCVLDGRRDMHSLLTERLIRM